MAFEFQGCCSQSARERTRAFFKTLSERDQRRFAALEARRYGWGGITYVAEMLGCCTRTIQRGMDELDQLPDDPAAGRVRRPGGGRKKKGGVGAGT